MIHIRRNNTSTKVSSPEDIPTAFSNHWLSKSDDHNFLQSLLDTKHNAYRQSNDEPPKQAADFMEQDIEYFE